MATGRINRKVLDHIAQINRENTERRMSKDLKKEVETGKHGTQKYVLKQGINKENEELRMTKDLKKEVETGKHGTQKYVIKQGENKGKTI